MKTKLLILLILIVSILQAEQINQVNYRERTFLSKSLLPEGTQFVCIDKYKWLEKTSKDTITLTRMYYYDYEAKQMVLMPCE